jgi:hypothetical protein
MSQSKSLELLPKYNAPSSWWEHVPIAHWLVEKLKPATIVELGTHYGVSFFNFCEAAEKYSPNTYIYAIDTWQGDEQAGYYENNVYEQVSKHRDKYHSQRSSMLRCMFEEAALKFSEKSIDIIHIDGLHTYEAVKSDFEKWENKLKKDGTIIFHDWNVREQDFGVWKLWEEVKGKSEYKCIETPNGYGLGLATLSAIRPEWHDDLQKDLPTLITKGKLLRELQDKREENRVLLKQKQELEKHTVNLEKIRSENMRHIDSLSKELKKENQKLINNIKNRLKKFFNRSIN